MKIAILSDLHGNLEATETVLNEIKRKSVDGLVLLGDLIDYGPHSNEVVSLIADIDIPILCNIWGNHEHAIVNEIYDRFSSERGKKSAAYTRTLLTDESFQYLETLDNSGMSEFIIDGKICLGIHASLEDPFWKSITPETSITGYEKYDYVFSGHSHEQFCFDKYSKSDCEELRNKKKTTFINPGSVGQPRNHNNRAQYCILDTESGETHLVKTSYDYEKEMKCFSNEVDAFYKYRLANGV